MVGWWWILTLAVVGVMVFSIFAFTLIRWFAKREPYCNFLNLRSRRKLTFIRLVMRDHRVPWYVKTIPVLLAIYLMSPIDIIPDFIPVLGYMDDVVIALLAFVLIFKLTSGPVVTDLLQQARGADAPAS